MIAIHQPNFFPWLGYFHKIVHADKFVILDDVQLVKTGGSYTHRVKFLISGKDVWYSVPVKRPKSGTISIAETEFHREDWHRKFLNSLQMNYAKHKFFGDYFPEIEKMCKNHDNLIANFNEKSILWVCSYLGISEEKFILSSSLGIDTTSTERLADIVTKLEDRVYLEGGGAGGYQEDSLFEERGLKVQKQNFKHPTYEQKGSAEFKAGLSILDAFFNIGHEAVADLLKGQKIGE